MTSTTDTAEAEPQHAGIDRAIDYLASNYRWQPSLTEAAAVAGMSPHHFQRTFADWTGVSPKRFLQYVTLGHARRLLAENVSTLETSLEVGLSGTSRLHDLFITCEAVTPGAFKARGNGLSIRYGLHDSPFGRVLIGVTEAGLCWLGFRHDQQDDAALIAEFEGDWPAAETIYDDAGTQPVAEAVFAHAAGAKPKTPLRLLLRGTNFQIRVWQALLQIPLGQVASYNDVAAAIGSPKAARAAGRAVGANPISLIIPCHRVILNSGVVHNYRWGVLRKRILLALEAAQTHPDPSFDLSSA